MAGSAKIAEKDADLAGGLYGQIQNGDARKAGHEQGDPGAADDLATGAPAQHRGDGALQTGSVHDGGIAGMQRPDAPGTFRPGRMQQRGEFLGRVAFHGRENPAVGAGVAVVARPGKVQGAGVGGSPVGKGPVGPVRPAGVEVPAGALQPPGDARHVGENVRRGTSRTDARIRQASGCWVTYRKTLEVALRAKFGIKRRSLASTMKVVSKSQPSILTLFAWLTRIGGNEAAHEAEFSEAAALLLDSHVEQLMVYLFTVTEVKAQVTRWLQSRSDLPQSAAEG